MSNGASAGGGAPTWTKKANPAIQFLNFGSGMATFASQAINNLSSSDVIVVMAGGQCSNGSRLTSVMCGGDAMTKAVESGNADVQCQIWYITGHIYTTPNIVFTAGSLGGDVFKWASMTAGVLTGVTAVPTSTGAKTEGFYADPFSASSVTNPAGGYALAVALNELDSNPTWDNMTEDYDLSSVGLGDESLRHTSAYSEVAGALAAQISGWNFSGQSMAVATWGA